MLLCCTLDKGAQLNRSPMPNVASVLREEIIRLARKEIRPLVGPLKKSNIELRRTVVSPV